MTAHRFRVPPYGGELSCRCTVPTAGKSIAIPGGIRNGILIAVIASELCLPTDIMENGDKLHTPLNH